MLYRTGLALLFFMVCLALPSFAMAQEAGGDAGQSSDLIRTALILTVLAVVPAIFISMTCFIRIAIVLAMVRHAFGMPQTPPNTVLISLAMFLTFFVMSPTLKIVNENALTPLINNSISVETAISEAGEPLKNYMLSQVRDKDIETMYSIAKQPLPTTPDEVDLIILTPAFILNELRVSFTIGFIILLPFLLIDLVVSSVLLSLGMMMVPPSTISLPIKLLMFVVIDGWSLIIEGVLGGLG